MACAGFSVFDLRREFGISFRLENLFGASASVEPTAWLRQSVQASLTVGIGNERARAERLVSPVLMALCDRNDRAFSVHSAAVAGTAHGIGGHHGFTCSFNRLPDFIQAPVFLVVDTCYRETDEELLPLLQQLIAAHRLNETGGNPTQPLYGCSTTGTEWRFLKYEGSEFILDEQRYFLNQLPALLGALQAVVDAARGGVAETGVDLER